MRPSGRLRRRLSSYLRKTNRPSAVTLPIYSEGELQPEATVANFASVVNRGLREDVEDDFDYYNLDVIISVGYRTNSVCATQFRQWATYILRQFTLRGYVLDHKRMENGSFFGEDYFKHLLAEILALIEKLELEVVGVTETFH